MQIIVLCTYNGEKYLREQIQSLLTQDYSGELLLLLSDDGSTDGAKEILRKTKDEYGDKIFLYQEKTYQVYDFSGRLRYNGTTEDSLYYLRSASDFNLGGTELMLCFPNKVERVRIQ